MILLMMLLNRDVCIVEESYIKPIILAALMGYLKQMLIIINFDEVYVVGSAVNVILHLLFASLDDDGT